MAVINENVMNNNNGALSDLQIERIELAVAILAKNSNNAEAITLAHNLKMSKGIEEKRKWIVLYYVSCFQLLSFINMARDKEYPIDTFKLDLNSLFIKK